eukprot:TRINITY_DN3529_c0_g1_i1.p6 TRINITY_DN3529_c0_g1~~TRINITY_DN3529_c0_g1_i1.p6  ORF type:complete len:203 (-),score=-17.00 TRINITY_DN3529_c0_g1_i1:863-1471(-)
MIFFLVKILQQAPKFAVRFRIRKSSSHLLPQICFLQARMQKTKESQTGCDFQQNNLKSVFAVVYMNYFHYNLNRQPWLTYRLLILIVEQPKRNFQRIWQYLFYCKNELQITIHVCFTRIWQTCKESTLIYRAFCNVLVVEVDYPFLLGDNLNNQWQPHLKILFVYVSILQAQPQQYKIQIYIVTKILCYILVLRNSFAFITN